MRQFLSVLLSIVLAIVITLAKFTTTLASRSWEWSRRHPSQAMTVVFVVIVHGVGIAWTNYSRPQTTVLKPRASVAVQTIQLRKPKPKAKPKSTVAAVTKKAKPPQKKKAPKPVAKKKITNTEDKKRRELMSKALASLERVETTKIKPLKLATPITSLQMETSKDTSSDGVDPRDLGYCEELVRRLQLQLRLPDFGEVRVRLTLNREGKVVDLKVLDTKSKRNRDYVEQALPGATFPPFGSNFRGESQHTFVLALANDV